MAKDIIMDSDESTIPNSYLNLTVIDKNNKPLRVPVGLKLDSSWDKLSQKEVSIIEKLASLDDGTTLKLEGRIYNPASRIDEDLDSFEF